MTHRFFPFLVLVSVTILMFSSLVFTRQGFFIRSGQHDIYKMGLTGEYSRSVELAEYEGEYFNIPPEETQSYTAAVLGESASDSKRIEIDLSHQKLYAYDGNNLAYDLWVSTGKPWWATPTGEFRTWIKLGYQRMQGGSKALGTYYDLPNVPHIMYFYNENTPKWKGYGIHGAYWHNNFGQPMSHGCINLKLSDAEQLYKWAGVGTKVVIYGQTPSS